MSYFLVEEQVYDKVAGQVTGLYISLMQKAIKTTDGAERSPPLATIDEFLCLKKIIEKKYITAFDQVVGSFRVSDGLPRRKVAATQLKTYLITEASLWSVWNP